MSEEHRQAHDALVQVRLRATETGGRKTAIPPILYRGPIFFGEQRDQANDCAFFFNEVGVTAEPGGPAVTVPIKFFVPELVVDRLRPGVRFTLWEGRDIGEAEIVKVEQKME